MSREPLYLRADVAAEPTVDGFYAWSHLVAPATAALQLARSHLKILDSFVKTPAVHAAAVKNPAMRGGPFLDLPPEQVGAVRALAERLRRDEAQRLELASALGELELLLAAHADGHSLEPLYARVPEPLRGYVELAYDPAGQAGFRLFERLLYRSPCFARGAQAVFLRRLEGDARPFVLSTPRVEDGGAIEVRRPFDHPGLGAFFGARVVPRPLAQIAEALALDRAQATRLEPLFTPERPRAREPWSEDGVRVRYFGHACVLVEARGVSVLTDPLVSYDVADEPPRFTLADLPERIDVVLITHGHQDHLVLESLLPLRSRVGTVVVPRSSGGLLEDPSLKLVLEHCGFPRVVELDELESFPIEGGEVVGLPFLGEHGDLRVRSKIGYALKVAGRSLVFAADSCNLESRLYEHLREALGALDLLFLGMECDGAPMSWLYGALLTTPLKRAMDQSRRLCGSNFERARELVERLDPARVFVYAMGQEPWCRFITSIEYTEASLPIVESNRLIEHCRARGRDAERLFGKKELHLAPELAAREPARHAR